MRKKHLLYCLSLLITHSLWSQQQPATVSGYITDAASGEALIGATVYDYKSGKGSVANVYGFYSLTLPGDSVLLRYSFVGYDTRLESFYLGPNRTLNIEMGGSTLLQGVEISAERAEELLERTQMSSITLSLDKVKSLPVLLGERDVLKTLQLMPGVQSGVEGASGLYVRGGGPDQNLILLDGVPVYNASHLFGFFSIFNTDALNSVQLIKGGFPAEYGGRLSSVIDMRMKEGNAKKIQGEGGIGIIAARLTLEGPIIKDKTSFMVSGRRTYIDALTRPIIRSQSNGSDGGYFFYDVNAKVNHKFSDRSRVFASGYFGRDLFFAKDTYNSGSGQDRYEETLEAGLGWGNAIAALRWNYVFGPRLFSNSTLTYSRYNFDVSSAFETTYSENGIERTEKQSVEYLSGIRDWSAKIDFSYFPIPDHEVKFGASYIYHTFIPGVNRISETATGSAQDTTFGSNRIFAHEFYTYVQDDWRINERIKVNGGLHLSGFSVNGKQYYSAQPRLAGRYLLNARTSVKLSYAHMAQFLHLLTNAGIGLPTDLWVPPTENIKPQLAHQVAAGAVRKLPKGFELALEVYYKRMQNLIEYQDGASFLGNANDWQNLVTTGRGWSYGAELMVEKKVGKTSGWIGYTLSWTERQFEDLNFGKAFPYRYDRRHDLSLAVTHVFNDRVDVGLVWVYGTGSALTLPMERYRRLPGAGEFFFSPEIGHIDARNNSRMPAYHRLDLGVNLHKDTRWGKRTWSFGLYNAYSRQNPFFLYFSNDDDGNQRLTQLSLFPIIPSVTYNFKF
jgi:hypothetical protein